MLVVLLVLVCSWLGSVSGSVSLIDRDRIRGARGVLDRELDIQSNATHLDELIEW